MKGRVGFAAFELQHRVHALCEGGGGGEGGVQPPQHAAAAHRPPQPGPSKAHLKSGFGFLKRACRVNWDTSRTSSDAAVTSESHGRLPPSLAKTRHRSSLRATHSASL